MLQNVLCIQNGNCGFSVQKFDRWINQLLLLGELSDTQFQQLVLTGVGTMSNKTKSLRTSLVVQWIRLCAPNAGALPWILGPGTDIPHTATTEPKSCNEDPLQTNKCIKINK